MRRIDMFRVAIWTVLISMIVEVVLGIAGLVMTNPPLWLNTTVVGSFGLFLIALVVFFHEYNRATWIGCHRVEFIEVHQG